MFTHDKFGGGVQVISYLNRNWYILLSLAMGLVMLSQEITSYDAYNHMFFAKHYRESWFSLIDAQTGGGLDMSTYPPLSFQLVAILSVITGYEWSYRVFVLVFWVLLSYYSAKTFVEYLELGKYHFYFYYFFMFFSVGVLKSMFVFGQFPTIAGMAFGFASVRYYYNFLSHKLMRDFAIFLGFAALTAFTHHFSLGIFGVYIVLLTLLEYKLLPNWRQLKKIIHVVVFFGFITFFTLYPFFDSVVLGLSIPFKEISHLSRNPLLNQLTYEQWITTTYGLSGVFIFLPLFMNKLKITLSGRRFKLYVISCAFFLFSLGRTTPVTKAVFGNLEHWLTYDRFGLMSSLIFTFIMADTVLYILRSLDAKKMAFFTFCVLSGFVIINLFILNYSLKIFGISDDNIADKLKFQFITNFLNATESNYRYQIFGYDGRISKLFLYTNASSLDTEYFTGQKIMWVRDEGIETINSVFFFNRSDFFDKFMGKVDEYFIKYVITANGMVNNSIEKYNWTLIGGESGVSIWKNPDNVSSLENNVEKREIFNYFWGAVPLVLLISLVGLLIMRKGEMHESMHGNSLSAE